MASPYYIYGKNLRDESQQYLNGREKYTSVVHTPYGVRRYFSSIDTDVYFGDYHVDEMVAFDFTIEERKLPIYGYNNFVPKRMITGQKMIQGSFAINFTRTFNLSTILKDVPTSIYANAYDETQFYCSDDNAALFGKGFDITISYGDDKGEGSYNSCNQTLVGVYITSYRQAFDTSGEPILDMYTFVAKDLLSTTSTSETIAPSDSDKDSDNITTPEQYGPESDYLANELDSSEQKALDYYAEHKNDNPKPTCIDIAPVFIANMTDISYKITSTARPINTELSDFGIESFKIKIADDGLTDFVKGLKKPVNVTNVAYNMKQDKANGSVMLYYTVTLANGIGNAINKYFEDTDASFIECDIDIKYKAKRDGIVIGDTISKSTKIYIPMQ